MGKIEVEDYGDILALKCDGKKIYFSEKGGSYHGSYVAVIESETDAGVLYSDDKLKQYFVFIDYYGSCSGCDWLEAEADWDYDTDKKAIDAKKALEYATQASPIYILEKKPTQAWVDKLAEKINS